MHPSGFESFVWAASFIGQILLLFVLFARRRARQFPIFTAYFAQEVLNSAIVFALATKVTLHTYQHWFWSTGILDEVLQLLVVYEIGVHVFCPTGAWARDVRRTFLGFAAGSAMVAFMLAWLAQPAAPLRIQTFVLRANFFSATMMSELFVSMIFLSSTVGLPWRTHVARIAQGLGTYSIVCLGIGIIANVVGLSRETHTFVNLTHFRSAVFLACEAYWIAMLWAEAPAPRELPEIMRMQIYTLQKQVENDLIRIRAWRKN